ncbi:MAG TPA: hypothetical protein PLQ56_27415 [Aggregatilineales bacterium]|nr:hypothetical protein [Aggregatilineales bacterium]
MKDDCTNLDWKPVLLVKVTRLPFGDTHTGLSMKRLYLAQHPDGILRADWTLPADERYLPLVQAHGLETGTGYALCSACAISAQHHCPSDNQIW